MLIAIEKNYLQTKKQQPSTGYKRCIMFYILYVSDVSYLSLEDSGRGHSVPVGASQGYIPSSPVPLLPVPVIERHKLTPAEIRALPRFGKYDPGTPSKVLYNNNSNNSADCADNTNACIVPEMHVDVHVEKRVMLFYS